MKVSSWEEERYQWEGLRRTRAVEVVKALEIHTKTSGWDAIFYIYVDIVNIARLKY